MDGSSCALYAVWTVTGGTAADVFKIKKILYKVYISEEQNVLGKEQIIFRKKVAFFVEKCYSTFTRQSITASKRDSADAKQKGGERDE